MTEQPDFSQRFNLTEKVYECLKASRNVWIDVHELAQVGGFSGWRTRVSEARALAAKGGDVIEWNRKPKASAYRLRAEIIGRDSTQPATDRWPIPDAPYQEPFRLT